MSFWLTDVSTTCLTSHHTAHTHSQTACCLVLLLEVNSFNPGLLLSVSCSVKVTWPLTCLTQGWWFSKNCCPGVIRLCNYWRDCCFPDKGCLHVWYYFYPEVCNFRKATSTRHNRVRKQTLPDTTRDLLAKSDTDLTGEQPHGLYSPPHHRHSIAAES